MLKITSLLRSGCRVALAVVFIGWMHFASSAAPAQQESLSGGGIPRELASKPAAQAPADGNAPSARRSAPHAEATSATVGTEEERGPQEGASVEQIVVTATRRESPWKDAPAMVTVVSGEEIAKAPEKTVDGLLRRIPSVSFSRIHAAECGPGRDITLRGIPEQKRTLILVDGIPVNDGITGAVNWSMVPKEAVERIEVVRGPMSALYGSGAMGGVINVITRMPWKPNETTLKAGYGSLNTYLATLVQGGAFEKGGYFVAGNLYKSDGYVQAKHEQDYHTRNARTDLGALGQISILPDDRSRLTARASYVNEDYSRGIRTDDQINSTGAVSLTYEREMKRGIDLSGSAYVQLLKRKVDLGSRRTDYTAHDHTENDHLTKVGELFQTSFQVADFNTITVGIDSTYSMMDKHNEYVVARSAKAEGNQLLLSPFVQDEMRFAIDEHELLVTPGVRIDYSRTSDGRSLDTNPAPNPPVDETYPDRSWVAINPRLSLVYRYADSTTLRASVGRSFAAPTLFELYTVFTRGPLVLYANPDLDPETAWSSEIGLDQWFTPNLLGRLTVYFTRGSDFIDYRTIALNQLQVDNITEVQALGLDCELRYQINDLWTLYGGYTFNRSTVIEDAADRANKGNYLLFEPLHRARLGVIVPYSKWLAIDLGARYQGELYTDLENTTDDMLDDHVSLDLSLSGQIIEHVSWALTFENLLDSRYDVYSVPTESSEAPGILITGYLKGTF